VGQRVDRKTNVGRMLLIIVALSIASDPARVQSSATSTAPAAPSAAAVSPTFDVVSIRSSKPGASGSNSDFSNETYHATNVTLKEIIQDDEFEVGVVHAVGSANVAEVFRIDLVGPWVLEAGLLPGAAASSGLSAGVMGTTPTFMRISVGVGVPRVMAVCRVSRGVGAFAAMTAESTAPSDVPGRSGSSA
jgi:hypothetical protein